MIRKCSRVAVIGAGPAAAIATDALVKEQAFDTIRVFERKGIAGGTWYVHCGSGSCICIFTNDILGCMVLSIRQRYLHFVRF